VAARLVKGAYAVEIVAPARSFRSWSGVRIEAHNTIAGCRGAIDTLIVAGGDGVAAAEQDERLIAFLRRAARRSRRVARWLVLFLRRPGGQSQFSAALAGQPAEREPLRELQGWIVDHLDEDLSVPALAVRACMSPRNFARAFKREVGMTPAAYVEALRVERARGLLETGGEGIEQVALRCGFGTVETMRRVFRRRLGVSPGDYRDRFHRRAA